MRTAYRALARGAGSAGWVAVLPWALLAGRITLRDARASLDPYWLGQAGARSSAQPAPALPEPTDPGP